MADRVQIRGSMVVLAENKWAEGKYLESARDNFYDQESKVFFSTRN